MNNLFIDIKFVQKWGCQKKDTDLDQKQTNQIATNIVGSIISISMQ